MAFLFFGENNMFTEELNYIEEARIREAAKVLLDNLPDYFYKIPASSTGKYHPDFASGDGGLVRHTKVAVRMAYELYQITPYDKLFTRREKDCMLLGLLIHDGLKKGNPEEKYTRFDHPILAAEYVKKMQEQTGLSKEEAEFISHVVKTHMGKWNTDYNGNEILEVPKDRYQYFVHMCDYLASRKVINVKFDDKGEIM